MVQIKRSLIFGDDLQERWHQGDPQVHLNTCLKTARYLAEESMSDSLH